MFANLRRNISEDQVVRAMQNLDLMPRIAKPCNKNVGSTKTLSTYTRGVEVAVKPCGFISWWYTLVRYFRLVVLLRRDAKIIFRRLQNYLRKISLMGNFNIMT